MSWLESRTVFLICLSITGFTGFKTHAEKFCRLHSVLSPSEGRGILKYSFYRPAWCPQALPWEAAPGAAEGVNSASGAGAQGPLSRARHCRGIVLPGKRRLLGAADGNRLQRRGGARERRVRDCGSAGVWSVKCGNVSAGCRMRGAGLWRCGAE